MMPIEVEKRHFDVANLTCHVIAGTPREGGQGVILQGRCSWAAGDRQGKLPAIRPFGGGSVYLLLHAI